MIFIWGKKVVRRSLGYVADFCPVCRDLRRFEVRSRDTNYDEAIRLDPKLDEAYSGRGLARVRKRDTDRGIADCNEAIRLEPVFVNYMRRGMAWYHKGDIDRAINDFSLAIKLDPKSADAFNNRSFMWKLKNQHIRAVDDYKEAVRLDPDKYKR